MGMEKLKLLAPISSVCGEINGFFFFYFMWLHDMAESFEREGVIMAIFGNRKPKHIICLFSIRYYFYSPF